MARLCFLSWVAEKLVLRTVWSHDAHTRDGGARGISIVVLSSSLGRMLLFRAGLKGPELETVPTVTDAGSGFKAPAGTVVVSRRGGREEFGDEVGRVGEFVAERIGEKARGG